MKQPVLIDCVINYVLLDYSMAKGNYTPSGYVPLVKNYFGVPVSGIFNYSSITVIMLYLSGYTNPDIFFAVNFAQYICYVPSICMKRPWGESVGIRNWPGIVDLYWIPIGSSSILIVILMQISLACMDMRSQLIPPLLIVAPVASSHFQSVLFFVNQS